MITLSDRQLPGYDFNMELLATIPKFPCTVRVDMLREDFGLQKQTEVNNSLCVLRDKHDLAIRTENDIDGNGRCVSVLPRSWIAAEALALDYWGRVHGGKA